MNHIIARVRSRGGRHNEKYRKVLSDVTIYDIGIFADIRNAIEYTPYTLIENNEWYKIEAFTEKDYCINLLRSNFNSVEYNLLEPENIESIEYFFACQNSNEFYFQRVSKRQLLNRRCFSFGETYSYVPNSKNILINEIPDAIFLQSTNVLYFKNISSLTSIFKGIEVLYKEATMEETQNFLESEFISIENNFTVDKVSQNNRKRISIAIDVLRQLDNDRNRKDIIFNVMREFCPRLALPNNTFKIETDDDLKMLLYGIDQRFYTTPDGTERRIANSVIRL